MNRQRRSTYYQYLSSPDMALKGPDRIITAGQFERLKITVEDYRFVIRDFTSDLAELAADIRSRATVLRRLLVANDLFKAGKYLLPAAALRVTAKMLDFDPAYPTIIIGCGDYPWNGDLLPGMAVEASIKGVPPLGRAAWTNRKGADVSLSEYLDGLAIAVLGTRIRRRSLIKYIADKKAAHVSDQRKTDEEKAMDTAWSSMAIKIKSSEGQEVSLNLGYLELLAVIDSLARSTSIGGYIDRLEEWLATAIPVIPEGARLIGQNVPEIPIKPIR